ncbi:MAG TPA: DUF4105 domain-containing protein [Steroidobacteraceae bacterium]|nr:DUF4105 domain-containing protein [Steroidobacteraceae bacterium]
MPALLNWLLVAMAVVAVVLATFWGVLALSFMHRRHSLAATLLALLFAALGVLTVGALASGARALPVLGAFLLACGSVYLAFTRVRASNEREWKPSVAILPWATCEGDRVTVHNIRNFSYRTSEDYTVAYYDRIFDLRDLASLDLIASYWTGRAVAHIFLSFGFGDSGQLAISIERRDERGARYSALRGLFKNYELIYVVADERDVIHLRTGVRTDPCEDVYLYPVHAQADDIRRLFLDYLREINALREQPAFYNTLCANCTANIWLHARVVGERLPYSWKILLSGFVPEYLYEHGGLGGRLPFARLKAVSRINDIARTLGPEADFSRDLRAALAARRAAAEGAAAS